MKPRWLTNPAATDAGQPEDERTAGQKQRETEERAMSAQPEYAIRDVHTLFGLSYANMLVLPRALLQSMPSEWQERFCACILELDEHFEGSPDYEPPPGYRVQPIDTRGQLVPWRSVRVPHYQRGRTFVRGG